MFTTAHLNIKFSLPLSQSLSLGLPLSYSRVNLSFNWTKAMARNVSIVMLLLVMLLVLLVGNYAINIEAPTPQPHPTGNFPMYGISQGSLQPHECSPRCAARCSNTAYKKPCMFFCQKCCATCLCVPPGTYGNKQVCPCYNNWKTKRGGPKCPWFIMYKCLSILFFQPCNVLLHTNFPFFFYVSLFMLIQPMG